MEQSGPLKENNKSRKKYAGRQTRYYNNDSEATFELQMTNELLPSPKIWGGWGILSSRGGFGVHHYLLSCVSEAGPPGENTDKKNKKKK